MITVSFFTKVAEDEYVSVSRVSVHQLPSIGEKVVLEVLADPRVLWVVTGVRWIYPNGAEPFARVFLTDVKEVKNGC